MLPPRPPRDKPSPTPITLSKLLLVEGATPMHFFEALLQHLGLANSIEIRDFGGVGDFKTFLKTVVATTGFREHVRSVDVARDAEGDATAARQSVDDALRTIQLGLTREPGVFILPNNQDPGMLETLCMEAVKNEPALGGACSCVEEFFGCLGRNEVDLPKSSVISKNLAQAFLATREEVQLFPGIAAYRGYWPWQNPAFDPLKEFLRSL